MWKNQSAKVCKKWRCNHLQGNPTDLVLLRTQSCNLFGVPQCTTLMTFHLTLVVYPTFILNFARHGGLISFSFCFGYFFFLDQGVFLCLGFVINKKQKLQAVEAKCKVRSCIKIPASLGPPPSIDDWGCVPSIEDCGLSSKNVGLLYSFSLLHKCSLIFIPDLETLEALLTRI